MGIFDPNIEKLKEKRDVNGLIKAIKHTNPRVRNDAICALGKIRNKIAVEPLIQTLTDREWSVRENAAEALGKIGDKRAVEPLIQVLRSEDTYHGKEKAIIALGKIGDERAIKPLIDTLRDYSPEWRSIEALSEIGEPAIKFLSEALKDEDWNVRHNSVTTLGIIGEPAIEALIQALRNKYKYVREEAAKALGKLKCEPKDNVDKAWYLAVNRDWKKLSKMGRVAVEPLIEALRWDYAMGSAAQALGDIGDDRAVGPLIEALSYAMEQRGDDTYIQIVSEALAKIGDYRAIEPLVKGLKDYGDRSYAEALVKFGDIASKYIMSIPNWRRQIQSLWVLSRIQLNAEIIPYIINWLFATPRKKYLDAYHYKSSDLYLADDALKTLSPHSNLNEEIINLLIQASSFSTKSLGSDDRCHEELDYHDTIEATKKLCKLNNYVTTNLLYMISQKKDISVTLCSYSCITSEHKEKLSFTKQRAIATEEIKRRGFTEYDPSVYFKK